MIIKQFYEKCLSQASYYIENNGIAAIIDPLRDTEQYLHEAFKRGAKIQYIFETHFHADFVSGHLELAKACKAEIIFGPGADTGFEVYHAKDGELFNLNGIAIKVLHTPGHTLESCCYLLKDETGEDHAIFTGDTLFIGDVGRPDLAQGNDIKLSMADLSGMLYNSLREKVLPLSDHLIIYPGHGAGSACGKNLSSERSDTLGNQRKTNYALNSTLSKEGFTSLVCTGLQPPPQYFSMNADLNKNGYGLLLASYQRGEKALSCDEFEKRSHDPGTMILDVRSAENFAKGHVPGAINIGLDGSFAPWVGALIPVDQKDILLVCDTGREREAITRLGRVGYDKCSGFLDGGITNWLIEKKPISKVISIEGSDFKDYIKYKPVQYIDVRTKSEVANEKIEGSIDVPLEKDFEIPGTLDSSQEYLVYCAGGYRSMIFISLMLSRGFKGCINVSGGFQAIQSSKHQQAI